jgi:hypothetical protein
MQQQKELFINSVRQVRLDGHTVVPTLVLYKDRSLYTGFSAIDNAVRPADVKENFKIELGMDDPIKLAQIKSRLGAAPLRSTLGIAKDFMDGAVGEALLTIERQGLKRPPRILVAEPLSLAQDRVAHDEWLKNYRGSVRQILKGKFEEVDFMPEPFAVFQYYRYGVRHALVAQRQKQVALVTDFGGGTFDVSVIETTAAGDISRSGRNSKPLAARSIGTGGYVINGFIADALLFKSMERGVEKGSVRKAIDAFPMLKNMDEEAASSHRADYVAFARNYHRLLQSVEQAKVAICNSMISWRLDADLKFSAACSVDVPLRPFQVDSPFVPVRLEAAELRQIFEDRVWKQRLMQAIKETLKRAEAELDGRRISVVLLSGGSSNIRWLKPLMERDLSEFINGAEILELSENFQEIVAKGLAVECARRFYTEGQGDFRAVTYNRLCLGLNPNGNGLELKKFAADTAEVKGIEADEGVLLPSSTSLRGLIGRPIRWKVKLSKAPTHTLDYFFMRSSFDPEETEARHNLDSRVATPRDASFGSSIGVELTVREDGTAEPSFLYGRGSQGDRTTVVRGRPFFMDMTSAGEEATGETYLGFDFGTSTSSLSYVDGTEIRVYAERAQDRTWMGLSSLVEVLPYPAAHPLARFISETSSDAMDRWGREALEGMLAMAAYMAYSEHRAVGTGPGSVFKTFRQRSAGPLWRMFKECEASSGPKWSLCQDLRALASGTMRGELDAAVSQVALTKHGKRTDNLDYPRILEKVGNLMARAMQDKVFGYFEDAQRKAFSMSGFKGLFRNARGPSAPFIDVYEFEGPEDFPQQFLFLLDIESGTGLHMFPFVVRGIDKSRSHYDEPDVFLYDSVRAEREVAFKAVQERDEVVTSETSFPDLFSATIGLLKGDSPMPLVKGLSLRPRTLS